MNSRRNFAKKLALLFLSAPILIKEICNLTSVIAQSIVNPVIKWEIVNEGLVFLGYKSLSNEWINPVVDEIPFDKLVIANL